MQSQYVVVARGDGWACLRDENGKLWHATSTDQEGRHKHQDDEKTHNREEIITTRKQA